MFEVALLKAGRDFRRPGAELPLNPLGGFLFRGVEDRLAACQQGIQKSEHPGRD